MKLIVVTSPHFLPDEARILAALFDAGLDTLHLRKPDATADRVEQLLQALPPPCRERTIIHDFFTLKEKYALGGIHLNSRHPQAPQDYQGRLTRACHSLEEAKETSRTGAFDYVLLSPVYDSISKQGYRSGYSIAELRQAQSEGIINHRVVAMGGIDAGNLQEIKSLGFGGAALLGDIWSRYHSWSEAEALLGHFKKLISLSGQ